MRDEGMPVVPVRSPCPSKSARSCLDGAPDRPPIAICSYSSRGGVQIRDLCPEASHVLRLDTGLHEQRLARHAEVRLGSS